jgi:prepilin-type N-terminal cleavage/methylation domain-containing protein
VFERYREIQMRREAGESSERGFTLIELLIVIVVLGILAAIVIFSLTGVTGQSKAAACTSDGKSIEIAADAYSAANNSYPSATGDLVGTGTGTSGSYLQSWPTNTAFTFTLDSANNTVDVTTNGSTTVAYDAAANGCSSL